MALSGSIGHERQHGGCSGLRHPHASASLCSISTIPFLHPSYPTITKSFISVALESAAGDVAYFLLCLHSSTGKYPLPWVIGLAQGFWCLKHYKYQAIAETFLITAMFQVFIFCDVGMLLDLALQHWLLFVVQFLVDGVCGGTTD